MYGRSLPLRVSPAWMRVADASAFSNRSVGPRSGPELDDVDAFVASCRGERAVPVTMRSPGSAVARTKQSASETR